MKMLGPIMIAEMKRLMPYLLKTHHWRFFGTYAMVEVLAVLMLAFWITIQKESARKSYGWLFYGWFKWTYFLVVMTVAIHWLFGVNTLLGWQLGLSDCPPDYDSLTGLFEC